MSLKSVLVFLVSASLAVLISGNEPQTLECQQEGTVCVLEKVKITRNEPRFRIQAPSPERITSLLFHESIVEVLEEPLCEAFPNLESINLANTSLEEVQRDVFESCRNLYSLDLSSNRLKVMEPETLEPLKNLKYLYLKTNNLSELHLRGLQGLTFLYAQDNYLQSFSLSDTPKVLIIAIHTNELPDINVEDILAMTPDLMMIEFNSNPIPCSKVESVLSSFYEKKVSVFDDFVPRDRPYEMQEVKGIMCVGESQ